MDDTDDCLPEDPGPDGPPVFEGRRKKATISLDRKAALMRKAECIATEILRCSEKHELRFLLRMIDMLMPD